MRIADTAHIDAHQFELGAHVSACKGLSVIACDLSGANTGHAITWRDQAKNGVVPYGALSNGIYIRGIGTASFINQNTATGADFNTAFRVAFDNAILRTNTRTKDDHVGI